MLENAQQTNSKDGGIFLDRENKLQDTNVSASQDPSNQLPVTPITIAIIGVVVILIGTVVCIGKLLYKKSKRKKDPENNDSSTEMIPIIEMVPKKTAADHLQEIKGITQKALQPLRLGSSSLPPPLSEERGSVNIINSQLSSTSQPELRPRLRRISTVGSLSSYPKKPLPLAPPPSPLISQNDDIEIDPIRLSLIDALLLDYITPPSQINASIRSSRRPSVANSRTILSLPSRPSSEASRAPRDRLNYKRSRQSIPKYIIDNNDENSFANFQSI